ncbi:tyrosine-type recombinase/integrase [Weissella confusa]
MPLINIHGLRHTYITLAVEANIPIKALQAQVGHDDINTTLGVYTAVTKDMRAKTTELFTSLVNF